MTRKLVRNLFIEFSIPEVCHYGHLSIPKGTLVTLYGDRWLIDEFDWIDIEYSIISGFLKRDAIRYGIVIPLTELTEETYEIES